MVLSTDTPFTPEKQLPLRSKRFALPIATANSIELKEAWLFEKRSTSGWKPWVVVMQSPLLRKVGVTGYGVFWANGGGRAGEIIGSYGGRVLYRTRDSKRLAIAENACRDSGFLRPEDDKFLWVQSGANEEREWCLLNGEVQWSHEQGPSSFEPLLNDPLDLSPDACLVETDVRGVMTLSRRPPNVIELLDNGWEAAEAAELCWSYGLDYWRRWLNGHPDCSMSCRRRVNSFISSPWSTEAEAERRTKEAASVEHRARGQKAGRAQRALTRDKQRWGSLPRRRSPLLDDRADSRRLIAAASNQGASVFQLRGSQWDGDDLLEVTSLCCAWAQAGEAKTWLMQSTTEKLQEANTRAIILVDKGDAVAGCMTWRIEGAVRRSGGPQVLYIYELHLVPSMRNLGLGRALFEWAQSEAQASSRATGVVLSVDFDNWSAIERYESWGLTRGRSRLDACAHTGRVWMRMHWTWRQETQQEWDEESKRHREGSSNGKWIYRPTISVSGSIPEIELDEVSALPTESRPVGTLWRNPTRQVTGEAEPGGKNPPTWLTESKQPSLEHQQHQQQLQQPQQQQQQQHQNQHQLQHQQLHQHQQQHQHQHMCQGCPQVGLGNPRRRGGASNEPPQQCEPLTLTNPAFDSPLSMTTVDGAVTSVSAGKLLSSLRKDYESIWGKAQVHARQAEVEPEERSKTKELQEYRIERSVVLEGLRRSGGPSTLAQLIRQLGLCEAPDSIALLTACAESESTEDTLLAEHGVQLGRARQTRILPEPDASFSWTRSATGPGCFVYTELSEREAEAVLHSIAEGSTNLAELTQQEEEGRLREGAVRIVEVVEAIRRRAREQQLPESVVIGVAARGQDGHHRFAHFTVGQAFTIDHADRPGPRKDSVRPPARPSVWPPSTQQGAETVASEDDELMQLVPDVGSDWDDKEFKPQLDTRERTKEQEAMLHAEYQPHKQDGEDAVENALSIAKEMNIKAAARTQVGDQLGELRASAEGDTCRFAVGSWNMSFASYGSVATNRKLAWLEIQMEALELDVVVLQELAGKYNGRRFPLTQFRTWFRKRGFTSRLLAGKCKQVEAKGVQAVGIDCPNTTRNGVMIATRDNTCAYEGKAVYLEENTLGANIARVADGATFKLVNIHGARGEDSAFVKQLRAAVDYINGNGMLLGDLNRVTCVEHRAGDHSLGTADKALRGVCGAGLCRCCAGQDGEGELIDHARLLYAGGEETAAKWTRFGVNAGGHRYPSSLIDVALTFGTEREAWKAEDLATAIRANGEGAEAWLSDHKLLVVARTLRVTHAPARKIGRAAKDFGSNDWETVNSKLAERVQGPSEGGGPGTSLSKLSRQIHEAVLETASEHKEAYTAKMLNSTHGVKALATSWVARLKMTLRLAAAEGDTPFKLGEHSLFHKVGGLRRTWQACRYLEPSAIRTRILTKCRAQASYWCTCRKRQLRRESKRLMDSLEEAEGLIEHAPAQAVKRMGDAFRKRKGGGGNIALSAAFERDDPEDPGGLVRQGQLVREIMGRTGAKIQEELKGRGSSLVGFAAFSDVFARQFPRVRSQRGEEWQLEEELSWDRFLMVIRRMRKGRAVGADGLKVEWLLQLDNGLLKLYYDGLLECAKTGDFPAEWKQIVYVLLPKKHGDQRRIGKRRDIALMAQGMKILGRMLLGSAYHDMHARLHEAQTGWTSAHNSLDAASIIAHSLQSATRLKTSIYVMYVDLAKFFPSLHRPIVFAAELLKGLPIEVTRLTASLFAEAVGVYDSAHGLSASFDIDMGALMGCVLSPDRAKLVLDLAARAIEAVCSGAKVWGREDLKRIIQTLFADDWCGVFNCAEDMRRAWTVWKAWAKVSGCKLGVEGTDKTTYAAARFDIQGRASEAPCEPLISQEGDIIPRLALDTAYRHMGFHRRLDGSMADNVAAFGVIWRQHMRGLASFHLSRREFIRASNIVVMGLAAYYGGASYLSWSECEKLEATWRGIYGRKFQRPRGSPNFPLYQTPDVSEAEEGENAATESAPDRRRAGARVHLYSVMSAALMATTLRILSENKDTDGRAATEAALGLSMFSWGCRTAPLAWDPNHVQKALTEWVERPHRRCLADCILLVHIEMGLNPDEESVFKLVESGQSHIPRGALSSTSPIWGGFQSHALFEPDGLGLPINGELVTAGIVQLGQVTKQTAQGVRLMTANEIGVQFPELSSTGRVRWEELRATIEHRQLMTGLQLVVDHKRCKKVSEWLEGHEKMNEFLESGVCGNTGLKTYVNIDAMERWTEEAGATCSREGIESFDQGLREHLAAELAKCIGPIASQQDKPRVERPTNAANCEIGVLMVAHLPGGKVISRGNPSRASPSTSPSPAHEFDVDEQGHLTKCGKRLSVSEIYSTDSPVVQAHVNARMALKDAAVVKFKSLSPEQADSLRKSGKTFIDPDRTREHFHELLTLERQFGTSVLYTVDGGWKAAKAEDSNGEGAATRASRAAVRHCGKVKGGPMVPEQAVKRSYQSEMGAHLAALEGEREKRALVVFDASSPVEAVFSFRQAHDRRRPDFLLDDWLGEWLEELARFEVVVFCWRNSHSGALVNEWADTWATKFMESEPSGDEWIPIGVRQHCSFSYTNPRTRFGDILRRSNLQVSHPRLRSTSFETVWPQAGQLHVDIARLPAAAADIMIELRGNRAFTVGKRHREAWTRRLQREVGACSCDNEDCQGDEYDVLLKCAHVVEDRRLLVKVLQDGKTAVGGLMPNPQWTAALQALQVGLGVISGTRTTRTPALSATGARISIVKTVTIKIPERNSTEYKMLSDTVRNVVATSQSIDKKAKGAVFSLARACCELVSSHRKANGEHEKTLVRKARELGELSKHLRAWEQITAQRGAQVRAALANLRLGIGDAINTAIRTTGLRRGNHLVAGWRAPDSWVCKWRKYAVSRCEEIRAQLLGAKEVDTQHVYQCGREWLFLSRVCRWRTRWCGLNLHDDIEAPERCRGYATDRHWEQQTCLVKMGRGEQHHVAALAQTRPQERNREEVKAWGRRCMRYWLVCGGNDPRAKAKFVKDIMGETKLKVMVERGIVRANMARQLRDYLSEAEESLTLDQLLTRSHSAATQSAAPLFSAPHNLVCESTDWTSRCSNAGRLGARKFLETIFQREVQAPGDGRVDIDSAQRIIGTASKGPDDGDSSAHLLSIDIPTIKRAVLANRGSNTDGGRVDFDTYIKLVEAASRSAPRRARWKLAGDEAALLEATRAGRGLQATQTLARWESQKRKHRSSSPVDSSTQVRRGFASGPISLWTSSAGSSDAADLRRAELREKRQLRNAEITGALLSQSPQWTADSTQRTGELHMIHQTPATARSSREQHANYESRSRPSTVRLKQQAAQTAQRSRQAQLERPSPSTHVARATRGMEAVAVSSRRALLPVVMAPLARSHSSIRPEYCPQEGLQGPLVRRAALHMEMRKEGRIGEPSRPSWAKRGHERPAEVEEERHPSKRRRRLGGTFDEVVILSDSDASSDRR